jgi:hypothetical protein
MSRILISPYCRPLRNGKPHPKNFPYWDHVIRLLKFSGCTVIQVGQAGENKFHDVDGVLWGLRFTLLAKELRKCDIWISVDNFFHHFACYEGKSGIVLMGQQDPDIFGHPENINLSKDSKYVRPNVWQWWEDTPCIDDCWVTPEVITATVLDKLGIASSGEM